MKSFKKNITSYMLIKLATDVVNSTSPQSTTNISANMTKLCKTLITENVLVPITTVYIIHG